mmetsp:Transcript_7921/g.18381  ORF Transcript_7921/g.18381 Transcript_7921/m.18381 type:complete len:426 (-) Transcript_7921:48-1325(-)
MRIRLNVLGVVHGIAGLVQGSAVGQVANVVDKVGPRQWGAGGMWVWLDGLRVVQAVTSSIERRSIWQVSHVVPILKICICIRLVSISKAGGVLQATRCFRRSGGTSCWSAHLLQNQIIGAEVWVLLIKATCQVILFVGALKAFKHVIFRLPRRNVPLGLLDGRKEMHAAEGEGLREAVWYLHALGVVVNDRRLTKAGRLCTKLGHTVKCHVLLAGHVVDLPRHGPVAHALGHEICEILTVPQLGDELAAVGHTDRAAPRHAVKEVPLHRIVIQRAVDVDGTDGSPVDAHGVEVVFTCQLVLVPRVGVSWRGLAQRQYVCWPVDAGAAHHNELLATPAGLEALDQGLNVFQLPDVVVKNNIKFPGRRHRHFQLIRLLPVCMEHSHSLQHLLVGSVADSREPLWLPAIRAPAIADHHFVAQLPELRH